MKAANLQLETLICPSCVQKIENTLKQMDGVEADTIKIMINSSRARFDFNEEVVNLETIEKAINNLGFEVLKASARNK